MKCKHFTCHSCPDESENLSRDLMRASGTIGTLAGKCAGLEEENLRLKALLYEYAAAAPVEDADLRSRVKKELGIGGPA